MSIPRPHTRFFCCALTILAALTMAQDSQAELTDGLVASWCFDHDFTATTGGTAFDATPINGVEVEATAGRFGGAARFIGSSSQYLSVGTPVITPGLDHSYSVWYRANWTSLSVGASHRQFILESKPTVSISYGLRNEDGDGLDTLGEVYTEWPGGYEFERFDHSHDEDLWNNLIVTYDASASLHTIYRNGIQVGTLDSSNPLSDTAGLNIGTYRDGNDRFFDGWIDDVGIWNRVLTPAEIGVLQTAAIDGQIIFTDVEAGLPGNYYSSVAWGDYDGDGDLDILMAGEVETGFTTLLSNDAGVFTDVAHLPRMGGSGTVDWGDYDNDGDLDILLTGMSVDNVPVSLLYRNDSGVFVDSGAELEGVYSSAADWGDYDNDGDLDILLCGHGESGRVTTIYRNDGEAFTPLPNAIDEAVAQGMAAWADYDNDGDLDILLTGLGESLNTARIYENNGGSFIDSGFLSNAFFRSAGWGDYDADGDLDLMLSSLNDSRIYRNDGGTFHWVISLPGLASWGSAAWGDYDNDGDLDLAMAGEDDYPAETYARVYRNDGVAGVGLGRFVDIDAGLEPVDRCSVAWGDYDDDGDLDLLLCGYGASGRVTRLYRNDRAPANTPPAPPANLSAVVVDNRLTVGWDATTDAQTPAAGLSYNLRLGTTRGGSEIMAAMADDATGHRQVTGPGNAQQNTSWTIDLSAGQDSVHWSVQAIDGAFVGSPFGTERSIGGYVPFVGWTDVATGDLADPGIGTGVAWGDYDNDGDLDLYLVSSESANRLLRNDGGGGFTDVAAGTDLADAGHGRGAAWGDYDNDGDPDLFLANMNSANRLYRNDGGGAFTDVAADLSLDDDGPSVGVTWVDFDGDGYLDLYLANVGTNRLYYNLGGLLFVDVVQDNELLRDAGAGMGVAWADYDNDGDPDIYLANNGSANKLLRNDVSDTGEFMVVSEGTPLADGGSGAGVAWGDYDNDGDLDLYLANTNSANRLFRNDGADVFTDVAAGTPLADDGPGAGVAWGDYDNDGDLDLYLVNTDSANRLFRNDGGGAFTDVAAGTPLADAGYGQGAAWGDYDNDGDLDLYQTNVNSANNLFRNSSPPGRHWLQVEPEAVVSNKSGIGARVRVVAGGTSQIREISGGSGYLTQDAPVASFGLGETTTVVDSLVVSWPSGTETVRTDVAVDRMVRIPELSFDSHEFGHRLARCLGLEDDQIHDAYLAVYGMVEGNVSVGMPEAAMFSASGDSVENSVLLSTGKASDGGLGSTDWGDQPGYEIIQFGLHTYVPTWAKSLHFSTQLISAEYDYGRPGVDSTELVFWIDQADGYYAEFQDAHLDTISSMCMGPVSPTVNHAFDVSQMLHEDRVFYLSLRLGESALYSDIDSALKITRFYFSEEELPPPDEPLPPDAPVHYLQTPMFNDVRLIAGSYTHDKDILEIPGPMPLRLSLSYNSDSVRNGRLGLKWTHGYDLYLLKLDDDRVVIKHGNGQTTYFEPADGGGFQPMYDGSRATLTETSTDHYTYVAESNLTYEFSPLASWSDYGQLDVVRDANGNETVFTHSEVADRLKERIDRISVGTHVVDFDYALVDTVELIRQIDVNGNPVAGFTYDGAGRLAGIDEYPNVGSKAGAIHTAITYDHKGCILTVTNGAGETEVANTYHGTLLVSQMDALGNTSTLDYDQERLIHVDRLGRETVRSYDVMGRLVRLEHPSGAYATYEYDDDGNLYRTTDALGGIITMAFDADGNMTSKTDALGNTETMTYDARGNVLTATDPAGHTRTYTYDGNDKQLTETDPLGHTTTNTYNAAGQLATTTDALGNTTTYEYDANGFLERTTDPRGGVTQYVRDAFGHPTSITDPNGHTTSCSYTVDGRLLTRTDPLGVTTAYTYDDAGRTISETTLNAPFAPITRSYTYTSTGLRETVTDGSGATTTFGYDAEGQRTSKTDPLGRVTSYGYDPEGRLVSVTDAAGGGAQASYDACNRLGVTDPVGNTTSFELDALGRMVRETDPLGNSVLTTYDSRGLIASTVNSRFQTFSYTYDDAGRLTQESYPGGTITHTLDAVGNETLTTGTAQASVARTFDASGQLLSRQDVYGRTVQYEYDAAGNVTDVVYPDGDRVVYAYDAADRLESVTDWDGNVTTYTYAQGGDLIGAVRPDGSRIAYRYDGAQRLVALTDSAGVGGEVIFAADFLLNSVGQRTAADVTLPLELPAEDIYQRMEYVANQLSAANSHSYLYDGDGNLVEGMIGGSVKTLDYDPLGRLVRCGADLFDYDADGYRVAAVIDGEERQYVYDALGDTPTLLAEYDGSGALVARYVHGLGLISREDATGQVVYYHHDTRGSTVALTRADGTTSDRYAYGPFGEVLGREGSTDQPFLFCGTQGVMDDGNGLYLMLARYYAPELMRFVQRDQAYSGELELTQTLNRYAYVEGNPILNIDPNGTWSIKKAWKKSKKKFHGTKAGRWAVAHREGITRVYAVTVGLAAASAGTALCGPACGLAAGFAAANLAGNLTSEFLTDDEKDDWKWNSEFGAGSEAMRWAAPKMTGCLEEGNPACYHACGIVIGLCGALYFYDQFQGGDTPPPDDDERDPHDVMNDFRPTRDTFDGPMSHAREARLNAWALTGSVCPMQK